MDETIPAMVFALGFSYRKRSIVRQFLGGHDVKFVKHLSQVPNGATVAVWASGPFGASLDVKEPTIQSMQERFVKRIFLEDGFLRSVGLGADLVRPVSWVIDRRGIYYDASHPSDLEVLLQTKQFDSASLKRAAEVRQTLLSTGITKYNVGTKRWSRPADAVGLKVILVPGQVETDASIRHGALDIKSNLALLKAARQANPNAWLIYKPHPDVAAGLRGKGAQEELASQWCNEIVTDVLMGPLLQDVDAVHVLTSLTGFEALLRDKEVVCYGLPFYAGWGLTRDSLNTPRRTRKLTIEELVAGTLLEYPQYVNRASGERCLAEQAIAELLAWRANVNNSLPLWRKIMRRFIKRP